MNPTAFEPVYKKAQEAGIPVVNTAVDSKEDTRLAYIGTNEINFGIKAAEALAQKMNGKANIAVLQTSLDSGNQNKEFESFKKTVEEKYPDMKIVVRETDESDMLKAVDKINAILNSNPEINVIWCLEAVGSPASAKVLEEKKLTDKITVLAIDDMEDTIAG